MKDSAPPRPGGAAISAHRGGSERVPAATYQAYRTAAGTGAEYIEFDIRRTADADWVVLVLNPRMTG
jgi:glycerophosphoryl diester phosphodiesterase